MSKKKQPRKPYPTGWIDTTLTAMLLGIQYQRARDAILQGRCGEVRVWEEDHRTRLVQRSVVMALKKEMHTTHHSK